MKSVLKNPWLASVIGAVLFAVTCYQFISKRAKEKAPVAPVITTAVAWDFRNPELDLIMAELKTQKESLAAREAQLKELAARLQNERQEINQLTQSVYQVQLEFDQNVTRVKAEEVINLKKLAKVYSAMTPEGAVAIFKELDDASIVKIAKFMKESETAPILELLAKQGEAEAKRTAAISERLRNSLPAKPLAAIP
jgi:flagellar motility protein MotE (MotC chaperone)